MSEPSSGPSDSRPASAAAQGPGFVDSRLPASSVWRVTIAALLGAVIGTVIGATWQALSEPDRPAEDSLGLLHLALVLGLPVLVVVSWGVLALTGPAWVAPTVTIAGLAAGSYAVGVYQKTTGTSGAPPVALPALAWCASYAAVALACSPRVSRLLRGAMLALLIAPAVLFLVR
ncbi:hypothetical protein SAMN05443287_101559 [Micromonospora phaseoli]|uniref:Uncharacterized protein n=1 Tax=Micromonospora phaseoli TaxID=1144548 RepID=A0A1H6S8G7_9ACTN|nr:hypothetical protein [Micromonospora phaseoli]PZW03808.1 hypothetical protein CLV64_101559 [Micromonospora phaseoli]GIJ79110.1 hypothetical protein Xph01_35420 [Micromonospora phaseoli]SEI63086.1 hypothetical protein SAMN05443287_101559 [Micromonospora phaseoli]